MTSPDFPEPPYVLLRIAAEPVESLDGLAALATVEALERRTALQAEIDTEAERLNQVLFEAAGPAEPDAGPDAARSRLAVVALKRAVFNRRRLDAETLETAESRLPHGMRETLEAQDARLAELEALQETVGDTFIRELHETRRVLLQAARDPGVQAALRLSSRALVTELQRLRKPEDWRHDERHAAATLAAYRIRAATKTSPHGLFCATAPATWASGVSPVGVQGENRLRLDVLLHVVEARKVAACVGSGPAAWPVLVPRVNPTLVEEDGAWVLWRPASLAHEDNREIRRRIARHPVAERFVDLARDGTRTAAELIAAVAREAGRPETELAPFFGQLADAGLLSKEIEIPFTHRRPLVYLAQRFRHREADSQESLEIPAPIEEIEAIEERVDALATLPPAPRIAAMDRLTERLDALPHQRPLERDELFRVDAASELQVALPTTILTDLQTTLSYWARLFAAVHPRPLLRRSLGRRFLEQHGPDREVPLLEVYRRHEGASKAESGKDPRLFFPSPPTGETPLAQEAQARYERARTFFARKAREALAQPGAADRAEVRLMDEDWEALVGDVPEPPWTAGAVFQVAAEGGPEALAAGRYRLALNDLFTGFGVALARFAHLHHGSDTRSEPAGTDPRRNPILRQLARAAERFRRPGAVLAEITYNHWGRAANAGLRIPFLEHEIELPGELPSPGATPIRLPELTLRWDSEEEGLALTWHPSGKAGSGQPVEVIPVISSGISPQGIIALLVGIGRQAIQPISYLPGFDGGLGEEETAEEAAKEPTVIRWPRFVHGRVVLFRQRWIFPPGTYPVAPTEDLDPDLLLGRYFAEVHDWSHREELPRHVFVCTEGQAKPFAVDLASPTAVDLLRRLVASRSRDTLHVTEMLPSPEELWVRDSRGTYATELLVQMGAPDLT